MNILQQNASTSPVTDSSVAGNGALVALRRATQALHEQLDRALPLSGPDAGLQAYVEHLRHLRHWLLELIPIPDGSGNPARAERRQLLVSRIDADLHDAGVEVAAPAALRNATVISRPGVDAAREWGVDYVVEGSQLGGSVLYKRLAPKLAPHSLRYLEGDGASTGPVWRAFLAGLQSSVVSERDIESACRGAVDAFTLLMTSFGLQVPGHAEACGARR